jgi:hypothetical protein
MAAGRRSSWRPRRRVRRTGVSAREADASGLARCGRVASVECIPGIRPLWTRRLLAAWFASSDGHRHRCTRPVLAAPRECSLRSRCAGRVPRVLDNSRSRPAFVKPDCNALQNLSESARRVVGASCRVSTLMLLPMPGSASHSSSFAGAIRCLRVAPAKNGGGNVLGDGDNSLSVKRLERRHQAWRLPT